MKMGRKLTRRGFLERVAGGGLAAGAALLVSGRAGAAQVTDTDQGPNSDPPGRGVRHTDNDGPPISDPPGRGRGRGSDSDGGPSADPSLRGRCTDLDAGPNADPRDGSIRCRPRR